MMYMCKLPIMIDLICQTVLQRGETILKEIYSVVNNDGIQKQCRSVSSKERMNYLDIRNKFLERRLGCRNTSAAKRQHRSVSPNCNCHPIGICLFIFNNIAIKGIEERQKVVIIHAASGTQTRSAMQQRLRTFYLQIALLLEFTAFLTTCF